MIDIHAHILPGLDDGSQNEYMTVRMLNIAAQHGTTCIAATPHCNCSEFPTRMNVALIRKLRDIQNIAESLGIKLFLGMELLYSDDLPNALESGKFITMNNSGYALIEFHFNVAPDVLVLAAEKIKSRSYIPLIAHPERYHCIQEDTDILQRLRGLGCAFQVNAGSLDGSFGNKSYDTVKKMFMYGYVDTVASDAHNDTNRNTNLEMAENIVLNFGDLNAVKLIFDENPKRILAGEKLLEVPEIIMT